MKTELKIGHLLIAFILLPLLMNNCVDDSYLIDGGTSDPNFDGTIMEFLQSKSPENDPKNDYFSDLIKIIRLAGMEDVIEKENITLFAPTNWSIRNSMDFLNKMWYQRGQDSVKSLEQIKPVVWKEFLSMYIIEERYRLKDIPQIDTTAIAAYPGQTYTSYGGVPMNAGVIFGDAKGVKYVGPRQIIYSYIYDITISDMKNAYVATSDIQPLNGVVHVIRLTDHDFGFDKYNFANRAIQEGIEELPKTNNEKRYE